MTIGIYHSILIVNVHLRRHILLRNVRGDLSTLHIKEEVFVFLGDGGGNRIGILTGPECLRSFIRDIRWMQLCLGCLRVVMFEIMG